MSMYARSMREPADFADENLSDRLRDHMLEALGSYPCQVITVFILAWVIVRGIHSHLPTSASHTIPSHPTLALPIHHPTRPIPSYLIRPS